MQPNEKQSKEKQSKMKEPKAKTAEELRSFGILMSFVLTLILGIGVYRRGTVLPTHLILLTLTAYFLLSALFAPGALRTVERLWMEFAERLSVVMTFVIMTLTFFLMVTPIGLLMRLLGRDSLQRRLDPQAKSYWEPVNPADGARYFLPY